MKKSTVVLFQIIAACLVGAIWATTNVVWASITSIIFGIFFYVKKDNWKKSEN